MRRKMIAALACCCITAGLQAQPYTEGRHTRHRFAQLNIGLDGRALLPGGSYSYMLASGGGLQRFPLGTGYEARAIIGGTHFWGHADFFVAIPLYGTGSGTRTGPETGARVYPWAIRHNHLRPYGGISFLPVSYSQGDGPWLTRLRTPLSAGFTFNSKEHLLDIGLSWYYRNELQYYISPTVQVAVQQQRFAIAIGYKHMLETTLSAEKNWQNGKTRRLTDTLAKLHRLNGLTIAAGPSSAFFMRRSTHNKALPYLDDHKITWVFADLGIGYYWHGPDVQVNLAWRRYSSELSAYGATQRATRRSVVLECYKFLGDYHGFVLFAGPAVSHERLTVAETIPNEKADAITEKIAPGVTFGWDIRPDRLQSFYLRTNLRYFPRLGVTMPDGKQVSLDALEVNFIQLVVFPGRISGWRK